MDTVALARCQKGASVGIQLPSTTAMPRKRPARQPYTQRSAQPTPWYLSLEIRASRDRPDQLCLHREGETTEARSGGESGRPLGTTLLEETPVTFHGKGLSLSPFVVICFLDCLLKRKDFFLIIWVGVCLFECIPTEARRQHRTSGARVTGSCEPPRMALRPKH